ncbi:MAG TPA: hypothetical protein PLV68_15920, partial [Ilumatobacteraceae bacterium]|nr:hypothetical protein [Ilumatobacteraceae bacterium]
MIDADERLLVRALLDRDAATAAAATVEYLDRVDVQTLPWRQTRMFPALFRRMEALGLQPPSL